MGVAWVCPGDCTAAGFFAIALLDTFALAPKTNPASTWLAGKPDQPLTSLLSLVLLAAYRAGAVGLSPAVLSLLAWWGEALSLLLALWDGFRTVHRKNCCDPNFDAP